MAFTYEEVAKLNKINEYRAVLRANKTFLRTKALEKENAEKKKK